MRKTIYIYIYIYKRHKIQKTKYKKKKKKKRKRESWKIRYKIENFGAPKLTKPKKKSKNTTKCHNNFTMHLFFVVVAIYLIFYFIFILTYKELTPQ